MRRVFPRLLPVLLLAPVLASCSDSATPVAPPPGAVLSVGDVSTEEGWPAEENWFTPGDVLTLAEEESVLQGADATMQATKPAVMVFGNPDAGTPYPPGAHDQSLHARDRIIPGTVVIDAGETVTFQVKPGHRVAIYNDGVRPEDIVRNPGPFVLDPKNRLFLQGNPVPQFTLRFVRPGKYLVLCAISNHFFNANMWGWLIVR
jgi:plastocyanin